VAVTRAENGYLRRGHVDCGRFFDVQNAGMSLSIEVLLNLGFVDIARWVSRGDLLAFEVDHDDAAALDLKLDDPAALYAFVEGDQVRYIGKTARSVRKRFAGYCRPGPRQSTNIRCHKRINEALASGNEVRILLFTPITHLRYGDFDINLAAGLEDSLIKAFDPPWNGREYGQPISEEAEREEKETSATRSEIAPAVELPSAASPARFPITVGPTYYSQGFINPGVAASEQLGDDGEPIRVIFDDGTPPVLSSINRTANRTGAVRVVGRNRDIARWFQKHCQIGDSIEGQVLDAHTIRLSAPKPRV
jgi:hypothetical protein